MIAEVFKPGKMQYALCIAIFFSMAASASEEGGGGQRVGQEAEPSQVLSNALPEPTANKRPQNLKQKIQQQINASPTAQRIKKTLSGTPTQAVPGQGNQTYMKEAQKHLESLNDSDISKRVLKREKARNLQKKGEKVDEAMDQAFNSLSYGLNLPYNTPIPIMQLSAATGLLITQVVQLMGKTVGTIMMAVGRYRERAAEIGSVNELLIDEIRHSAIKLTDLDKELGKASKPLPSGRPLSQSKIQNIKEKIKTARDLITNTSENKGEELHKIRAEFNKEREYYEENVRLLQIKLLQDAIKQIDQRTDKTALQPQRTELINKIKALEPFTKIGKANALRSEGIDPDTVFTKDGVIELYRELNKVTKILCSLQDPSPQKAAFCERFLPSGKGKAFS